MTEECKVKVVYATTEDESKLYKDLRAKLKDQQQALELWSMVRTPEFKSVYGDWQADDYKGKLDEFGEPLMKDVLSKEYIDDQEILNAAKKDAESYAESVEKMVKYNENLRDILTRKIAELERATSGNKGVAELKKKLEKLRKNLRKLDWKESTQKFAVSAKINIEYATRNIERELRKDKPSFSKLSKYMNYLSAHDTINDMVAEIQGNSAMRDVLKDEIATLSRLAVDKAVAKNKYRTFMENEVSKKLASVSNKHDSKALKEFLERAPFDIKARERWLRFAGDSRDTVISLTAKLINEQQQKTRHKSIEFTRELSKKVEALEEERSQFKGDPEKLYGPLLEKDSDGNLTGYFIDPKKSKPQYEEFQKQYAGTAIYDFYEYYLAEYSRLNDILPASFRMGNKLPTLLKKGLERIVTSENKMSQVKAYARNKFEKTNTDTATGELTDDAGHVIHQIPIHFTQAYDSAVYNAEYKRLIKEEYGDAAAQKEARKIAIAQLPKDLSYDMSSSLQAFQYMAENYSDMSEIVDYVEGAKDLLHDRSVVKTDSQGKPMFQRMTDLVDDAIKGDGSESEAYKMIQSLIETQVYGITEKDLGTLAIGSLQLDKRKLSKQLQSYNSILMLGVNVLAGTANIGMGETMQWAEAFGGEYYGKKDYIWANGEYSKQLGNGDLLSDVGSRTPKSKIGLINEFYDVLGDYHPDGVGASDSSSVRRAVKSGSLFFINSIGEHMMQSKAMLAVMRNTKTYNSDGKVVGNLYDSHDVSDGKLSVNKDTYIKVGDELVKYGEKQKRALSRQAQVMLRRMHGNYNKQTAAEWQRNGYFQLVGQFRKWVNDGYARRWDKMSYNEFADQDLEGTYRSFGKFMTGLINQLGIYNFEVGRDWNDMTKHQKSNVKKTGFEIGMFGFLLLAGAQLAKIAGELDEDEDKAKLQALRHGMYPTNRLGLELVFFIWPPDAWQILKSPAASMSVVEQTTDTFKYAMPWNWDEEYESGYKKGESRLYNSFKRQVPLWKQIERMSPEGIKGQMQFYNIS